jgi:uncharacterized protein (TIGR00255 family)
MTGFAKVGGSVSDVEIDVEVKAVNHRFLEVALRGVPKVGVLERELKGLFQNLHSRGRIEVVVTRRVSIERQRGAEQLGSLDSLVTVYLAACKRYGARVDDLAQFIGQAILKERLGDEQPSEISDQEGALLEELITRASIELFDSRKREGAALVKDIQGRLKQLINLRRSIEKQMSGASKRVSARLKERISALAPEIKVNPDRLAVEVALLAERVDVSEELVRLGIHVDQFGTLLKAGEPSGIGRKLDFLTQEIGRELNTIGSKAQDGVVQGLVVEAKSELEKIREQVQNIE